MDGSVFTIREKLEPSLFSRLGVDVKYADPTVKEFKDHMISEGIDENFVNVVVGIHFPPKLGLAKEIKHDFEKVSGRKATSMKTYIEDYKEN